jgi:hypothetical protein
MTSTIPSSNSTSLLCEFPSLDTTVLLSMPWLLRAYGNLTSAMGFIAGASGAAGRGKG